jgi:hypothetical protein
MDAKVEEFRNISQGSQKVQDYTTRFTCMMRYAPGETDTEKKKMYCFKKGLNSRLKVALSGHACCTLREMVNKVLEMERDCLEADALHKEKKRQFESSSRGLAPQRPHASSAPLLLRIGGCDRSEPWRWYLHRQLPPPRLELSYSSHPTQGASTWRTTTPTSIGSTPFTCFSCGQPSHKIVECPIKNGTPLASAQEI